MLPTRGRPEAMARSVRSLLDTADPSAGGVEILLGVDDDDGSYPNELVESLGARKFVHPRYGYAQLHIYYTRLAEKAKGDWLFLWNDDALMTTQGWNRVVSDYDGRFLVLNPEEKYCRNQSRNACIFPIVPTDWTRVLGGLSPHVCNDTYVELVANELGINTAVPILVEHQRADHTGLNDDETYRESRPHAGHVGQLFSDPVYLDCRRHSVEALRYHMSFLKTGEI